tara:strand:+ start:6975 stop:7325 length:351 start_codon:yes stop_codon:yes gene_type:complete
MNDEQSKEVIQAISNISDTLNVSLSCIPEPSHDRIIHSIDGVSESLEKINSTLERVINTLDSINNPEEVAAYEKPMREEKRSFGKYIPPPDWRDNTSSGIPPRDTAKAKVAGSELT